MNNQDENMQDISSGDDTGYDTDKIESDDEEDDFMSQTSPRYACASPMYKRNANTKTFKRFSDRLQLRERVPRNRFYTSHSMAEPSLPTPCLITEPKQCLSDSSFLMPKPQPLKIEVSNVSKQTKTRNPFTEISVGKSSGVPSTSPLKSPTMLSRAVRSKSMLDLGNVEIKNQFPPIAYGDDENQKNASSSIFQTAVPSQPFAKPKNHLLSLRRTTSDMSGPPVPIAPLTRLRSATGSLNYESSFIYPSVLPVVKKTSSGDMISSSTVIDLMNGKYANQFTSYMIIDCRYRYEFEGGHIKHAISIIPAELEDKLQTEFFPHSMAPETNLNLAIIFHCEFSSKRGPRAAKSLREMDRAANRPKWPHLSYPYVYIMEGGYQHFFRDFPSTCNGGYIEMKDARFKEDLRRNKRSEKTEKQRLRSSSVNRGSQRPSLLSRSANSIHLPAMRKL